MKSRLFMLLCCLSAVIMISACGDSGEDISVQTAVETEERVPVSIVDSIGVEIGDSNYAFANIMSLEFGPDGNIYVLDRGAYSLAVYTPDGEFIRRIGSHGSGPGELLMPLSMAVLGDGRIAICDPMQLGINSFSTDGEWEGVTAEFNNNPPMRMDGADSNAYVAFKITIEFEDQPMTNFVIARYEESSEPAVRYFEDEFPFDPENLTELLNRTIYSAEFATDREGNVYITPMTSEEYLVQVFDAAGNLTLEFERELERVEKSEDEIAEEKRWMEAWLTSLGVNGVLIDFEPDPYRFMTGDIGCDSQGRIWVRRGTELVPVFDVYDSTGEFLFAAEVEGAGEEAKFWDFVIDEHGMMAYSTNPEYFHKVWIMELPE